MRKIKEILSAAENRESFFKRISYLYPKSDHRYKLIEKAYNDAKDAFRGIYRDDGETRYFEHIRAVVIIMIDYLRVKDYRLIIAGLLHDIVEDVPSWTIERVRVEYGDDVALYIDYVTKPKVELFGSKEGRDEAYHMRFKSAKRNFFKLKLSDRLHNMLTLWTCTPEKRVRKIAETREHYLPYAEKHFILYHELVDAIDELEKAA